ncbi:MAG: hypothetical protein DBX55_01270 [Verrucomicrobia bacterium]|nr:MAG: hypothetical protein DBX55_01270 [Verrucomicrobiota bacterium]
MEFWQGDCGRLSDNSFFCGAEISMRKKKLLRRNRGVLRFFARLFAGQLLSNRPSIGVWDFLVSARRDFCRHLCEFFAQIF